MASIKHKLFEQYSTNLAKNSTLSEGWFICPLCHQAFIWDSESLLSIEHVIPRSLGGKLFTLTCKKCNNDFGSKYIHKLGENLEAKDRIAGKSPKPFDAKIYIHGKPITVEYFSNINKFVGQSHRSNPANLEFLHEKFQKGNLPEFTLNFTFGYQTEFEQMAVLLICYLLLFKYFGYSYALNPWGWYTRNVIVYEKFDSPLLKMGAQANMPLMKREALLLLCTQPKDFADYACIQLNLRTTYAEHTVFKFLPFLPGTNFQEDVHLQKKSLKFSGLPLEFSPTFLTEPGFTVPYKDDITIHKY